MLNIIKLFIFLFSLNQIKILNWKFEMQFLGSQLTYLGLYLVFVIVETGSTFWITTFRIVANRNIKIYHFGP